VITRTVETLDDVAGVLEELLTDELGELARIMDDPTCRILRHLLVIEEKRRDLEQIRVDHAKPLWREDVAETKNP